MRILFVCAVLIACAVAYDNWAVIISGAGKDFHNFSIQSVSCRITNMVIKNGIPTENVIHMLLDDLTWHKKNPFPGQLYYTKNGPDSREGCQMDYVGKENTKVNLEHVLKGNAMAVGGKKVLQSTERSKVFIYYIDHGNKGIVAMPDNLIWRDELIDILKWMNDNNKYHELLFYMTACHGGSMFHKVLPDNIKIFAMTSASPEESSYMASCPPYNDVIKGKHYSICLGDEVSDVWAADAESGERDITIDANVKKTKKAIWASIVSSYGD